MRETTGITAVVEPFTLSADIPVNAFDSNASVFVNHVQISGIEVQDGDDSGTLRDAINQHTDTTGITASIGEFGQLELTSDGRNITFDTRGASLGIVHGTHRGSLTLLSEQQFELRGPSQEVLGMQAGVYGVHSGYALHAVNVSSRNDAFLALRTIDISLRNIDQSRQNLVQSLTERPRTTCLPVEDIAACEAIEGDFTPGGFCPESCGSIGQCCDMESTNQLAKLIDVAIPKIDEIISWMEHIRLKLRVAALEGGEQIAISSDVLDEVGHRVRDITEFTHFDHQTILNGNFLARRVRFGEAPQDTAQISIGGMTIRDLVRQARAVGQVTERPLPAGVEIIIRNDSTILRASAAVDDGVSLELNASSAIAKAAVINEVSEQTGVVATPKYTRVELGQIAANALSAPNQSLTVQGVTYQDLRILAGDADLTLTNAINANSAQTGVKAELRADGSIELIAQDGRNISLNATGGAFNINSPVVHIAHIRLTSNSQFELRGEDGLSTLGLQWGVYGVWSIFSARTEVTSQEQAQDYADLLTLALERLEESKARLLDILANSNGQTCLDLVDINYCELREGTFTPLPIAE